MMEAGKRKRSTKAIPEEHPAQIRVCYQLGGLRGEKLLKKFPQYCKAAVYRHAKKPLGATIKADKRKFGKGGVKKLKERDTRLILRAIRKLRSTVGSFTSRRVQLETGLNHVSNRTIRRYMNSMGFFYCRSRKKGLMSSNDLKLRIKFCRKVRRLKLGPVFWKKHISFYLDAKGFIYKKNPLDEATAPKAREWRKVNEGLTRTCKGKKEGSTQVKFMVGISYNKGVVLCEQYFGRLNGAQMAKMIKRHFPHAFRQSINPKARRVLQDGCPVQNSVAAKRALQRVKGVSFSIPPRSPDINCIENFFHLVEMKLQEDTIEKGITEETIEEFSNRVKNIIKTYPIRQIDKLIETMDKRITMILSSKGHRIKY